MSRDLTPSVLELCAVSKMFDDPVDQPAALAEVTLSVSAGELVAVVGPSGSGKSTLLAVAGGLLRPTSGMVCVAGSPLGDLSGEELARLRRKTVGFVFQDHNLLSGLTAIENVSMPLELDGTPIRKARRAAGEVLASLGLVRELDAYPERLSEGQRQRVAIARALVGEQRLILADEPTAALDSVSGEVVMRQLLTASERGAGTVVVTHNRLHAAWADRVVFLHDGRLIDETATCPGVEGLLAAAIH